jgi:hypothetical protein
MPSLRSSIRRRLEAEEAEQHNPAEEAESNPAEQNPVEAEEIDNPIEEAAQAAIEAKLDEQPDPVVEPKPAEIEEYDAQFDDDVHDLQLRAADAAAQAQGHKFGTREYADAVASKLRQEAPRTRERGPVMMAPVTREAPSWSSGRSTPSKTELTHEEIAFARSVGVDPEEYRRNKAKMHQMKASGVIQE